MLVVGAATLPPFRVPSGDDWCPDSPQISPYQAKFYIKLYIVKCGGHLVVLGNYGRSGSSFLIGGRKFNQIV